MTDAENKPIYRRPKDIEENADARSYLQRNTHIMLPKDMSCAICMNQYNVNDRIATCRIQKMEQHSFHENCLRDWLNQPHIRCPCCRVVVKRPLQIIHLQ